MDKVLNHTKTHCNFKLAIKTQFITFFEYFFAVSFKNKCGWSEVSWRVSEQLVQEKVKETGHKSTNINASK